MSVSPKLRFNGSNVTSSSVIIKKRKNGPSAKRSNGRSLISKAIQYTSSMQAVNESADPFDRDVNEPVPSFYVCPQAPFHSNEYLMNCNAHKYHFDTSDLYQHINHTGTMEPCLTSSSFVDPYVTIHSLEQENITLRNRIEALEARIVQLETLAAT